MIYFLIVLGILFELIILVGGIYICLKYFKQSTSITPDKIEVKVVGKNITVEELRDGFKDAIKELQFESDQEKIFEKKRRKPENVYSSIPQDIPVKNSGGNLVPFGLTDEEKSVLEMFYGKD